MKGIKFPKINLTTINLVFLTVTTVFSFSQSDPKIWLSEYGYSKDTSESIEQVTFALNKNETTFSNTFLSITEAQVVVHGKLSFIVLTCEAEYPISWFLNQELKTSFDTLRTATSEYQSSTNVSTDKQVYFKSLLHIYLDEFEYYFDKENFSLTYPGEWKFSCQKLNKDKNYCGDPSINLIIRQNITKEKSNPNNMKVEEKIIIALLTKQQNTTTNSFGISLRYVMHLTAKEYEQITLAKNYTINFSDYGDDPTKNSNLVDYELNEEIKEGILIQMFCFSSKNFYSYGSVVEILWKNGTKTRVPEKIYGRNDKPYIHLSRNSMHFGNKLFGKDDDTIIEDMIYFLSEEIVVDLGMTQVNCYMPVWVDGKWDTVSREIKVVPKYI